MTEDETTIMHCLTKADTQLNDVCMTLIKAGQTAFFKEDTRLQLQLEEQVYALMDVKDCLIEEVNRRVNTRPRTKGESDD